MANMADEFGGPRGGTVCCLLSAYKTAVMFTFLPGLFTDEDWGSLGAIMRWLSLWQQQAEEKPPPISASSSSATE
jgi:hypothetical protein